MIYVVDLSNVFETINSSHASDTVTCMLRLTSKHNPKPYRQIALYVPFKCGLEGQHID